MKLLQLPTSDQIEKINQITIEYLNQIISEQFEIEDWVKMEVAVNRSIGHGTQIIHSKEITLFFEKEISKFKHEDINLSRLILKLLKRTKSEKVNIEILREGIITIKNE